MISFPVKIFPAAALLVVTTLMAQPAHAFRCKNKLVKDGMHEQQVIAACGKPTTARHLGYTIQAYNIGWRSRYPGGLSTERTYPGYGNLQQQVVITEYTYNFGPRKFMQRLIFEGGVLVTIETIGYGYHKKK
jgi:Protein of unknown function (DUF2845)